MDLRSSFPIFHCKLRVSCGRPPRVPPPFAPDLPLPLLHHYNTISTVAALQTTTKLEVACLRFGVQRDVLLSIEGLLLLTSPRLLRLPAVQLLIQQYLEPHHNQTPTGGGGGAPGCLNALPSGCRPRVPSTPSPPSSPSRGVRLVGRLSSLNSKDR